MENGQVTKLDPVNVNVVSAGQLEDLGLAEDDSALRTVRHVPTGFTYAVSDALLRKSPNDVLTGVVRLAHRAYEGRITQKRVDVIVDDMTEYGGTALSGVGVLVVGRLIDAGLVKNG